MSLDTFEQSLLDELRQHVVARGPAEHGHRPSRIARVAVAGLAAAAAGVVAVSVATGIVGPSASAAYAVESEPDGDVVVTIHDLVDASGLERDLAAHGVRAAVTYQPGFTQADGEARTTSDGDAAACGIALVKADGSLRFTLGAAQIAGGAELDIVTSGSGEAAVGSPVAVSWSGGLC
ncbi:hypothetical protein [Cellulomonas sp. URHD0024]|uniref:hypothetical protein n=1 Tax=Cellulomonas sp. URHD0024 TaxID=1302620 RepID=UPI00040653F4|nr:hypothetical protein [Cellulomonas sp. URHD0024]